MDEQWLDGAVSQVLNQLSQKDPATYKDVYVWSDGSVTGPKDNTEDRVERLRLVAVFSPDEMPTEAAVRTTLRRGMETAQDATRDEQAAVASGSRLAELPGTPPRSSNPGS